MLYIYACILKDSRDTNIISVVKFCSLYFAFMNFKTPEITTHNNQASFCLFLINFSTVKTFSDLKYFSYTIKRKIATLLKHI